jgi:hypothetical protein
MKPKKEYLIINKRTKANDIISTNDIRNWMINHLDLSDEYFVIESKYFASIKAALN